MRPQRKYYTVLGLRETDAAIERILLDPTSPDASGSLRAWLLDLCQLKEQQNLCESLVHTQDQKLRSEYRDGCWVGSLQKLFKLGLIERLWSRYFKTC